MKKINLLLLLAIGCFFTLSSFVAGYAYQILEGATKTIKSEDINVVFTYDNLLIGKMPAAEYMKREADERNKKEAGSGDKWVEKWKADRDSRFEPAFIEAFNKYEKKNYGTKLGKNSKAKYTMTVNVDMIEYGDVSGLIKPRMKLTITVTEAATGSVVLKMTTPKPIVTQPSGTAAYDAGYRVQFTYMYSGILLAKQMIKMNK